MSVFFKIANGLAEASARRANKIKAFHGSPHSFDRFSTDSIGTGEGAQAYGHGLYFAESEKVAKGYRDALTPRDFDYEEELMRRYKASENSGDYGRMEMYERAMQHDTPADFRELASDLDYDEDYRQMAADMAAEIEEINPNLGAMYQVDIDASPDEFLDWDLPLSEQSEAVKGVLSNRETPRVDLDSMSRDDLINLLQNNDVNGEYSDAASKANGWDPLTRDEALDMVKEQDLIEHVESDFLPNQKGGGIYSQLGSHRGATSENNAAGQIAASSELHRLGIKGIKYKDGASRNTDGGTSNYVVFDENIISIAKKYGIPPALAASILSNPQDAEAGGLASAAEETSKPSYLDQVSERGAGILDATANMVSGAVSPIMQGLQHFSEMGTPNADGTTKTVDQLKATRSELGDMLNYSPRTEYGQQLTDEMMQGAADTVMPALSALDEGGNQLDKFLPGQPYQRTKDSVGALYDWYNKQDEKARMHIGALTDIVL